MAVVKPLKFGILPTEIASDDYLEAVGYADAASGAKSFKSLKVLNIAFGADLRAYLRTQNSTFTVLTMFNFRGTNDLATPSKVTAVLHVSGNGVAGEFRLFNPATSQTIATQSFNSLTPSRFEITSTSNWPTAPGIVEVQLRRSSGSGSSEARVSALEIEWA